MADETPRIQDDIADVERIDRDMPPWIREWYEDGEQGEGPYGVHPGCRGEMVEGNDIITRPTQGNPDGSRVCECANGKIAAAIVLLRAAAPRLAAEVARLDTNSVDLLARIESLRGALAAIRDDNVSLREARALAREALHLDNREPTQRAS